MRYESEGRVAIIDDRGDGWYIVVYLKDRPHLAMNSDYFYDAEEDADKYLRLICPWANDATRIG